jgi:glucosamine--fructose-6-phosphate aminotransferase (isomerizing)
VIHEGQEQSVVQTRSFSAMTIVAQAAVASLVDDRQFQAMRQLPTTANISSPPITTWLVS